MHYCSSHSRVSTSYGGFAQGIYNGERAQVEQNKSHAFFVAHQRTSMQVDGYHSNHAPTHCRSWWNGNAFAPRPEQAMTVDMNSNGRFDRGRDGVLVFDFNCDGKYDHSDVSTTREVMQAATGNFDFDGNGCVDYFEQRLGRLHQEKYRAMDRSNDGRLDTQEIARASGRVWVDRSRDGHIGRFETHSPYNIPNGIFSSSRRLDCVNPWGGTNTSSNWWRPLSCRGGW